MLKFKDINYGYFPCSPSMGQVTLKIDLDGDDEVYSTSEDREKSVNEVIEEMHKAIEFKKLEEAWGDAMCAKIWILITGDEIMSKANIDASEYFMTIISHLSHELQVEMREHFHGKEEGREFHLTPPRVTFMGKPIHETGYRGIIDENGKPNDLYGMSSWFENFQIVYIDADDGIPNYMALLEMEHHANFVVIKNCNTIEDVDTFVKDYIDDERVATIPARCHIRTSNPEIIKHAFKEGFRVTVSLPEMNEVLKF